MDTLPLSIFSNFLVFSVIVLLIVLCLGSLWFYGYTVYSAIDYLTHADSTVDLEFHPKVSILKPLHGLNAGTYQNLRSFCQQDYPHYQIVFAVQDDADPSVEIVQKLMQEFPLQDIQLVVSNQAVGNNPKVNSLANAATEAKYKLWVIADSDIRVGKDYLRRIVQPLRYPGVGVVTCPYRSQGEGWAANLAALRTAAEFHPNMLVSRCMEGVHFALGSTIAIRKELLTKLGGFEAVADYFADDVQLGRLPAMLGYRVVLSDYVVEQGLSADSLWAVLRQHIRWARGVRVAQPWVYIGKIITYGTVANLLLLWVSGAAWWSWMLLALTWAGRLLMGWVVGVGCLQDSSTRRYWWLLPIYDLISFGVWCCGWMGNTIHWCNRQFRLLPGGKLQDMLTEQQKNYVPVLEEV